MTLPWRELREARDELRAAAEWYEDQDAHPRIDPFFAVDEAIRYITEWPNASPFAAGVATPIPVRTRGVRVFPYHVIYLVHDGVLIVVAYAHHRQPPGYWANRLDR